MMLYKSVKLHKFRDKLAHKVEVSWQVAKQVPNITPQLPLLWLAALVIDSNMFH